MQKNSKFTSEKLSTRIIPLLCFILALAISPIAFLNYENMPIPEMKNAEASQAMTESSVQEGSSDDVENTAAETDAIKEEVSADASDSSDAAGDGTLTQIEDAPALLTESYMLRELFSDVEFTNQSEQSAETKEPASKPSVAQKPVVQSPAPQAPAQVAPEQTAPSDVQTAPATETEPAPEQTDSPAQVPADEQTPSVDSSGGEENADEAPTTALENQPSAEQTTTPENTVTQVPVIEGDNPISESNPPAAATTQGPPLHTGTDTRGSIKTVRVLNHNNGGVTVLDLDEYIASVIVAEMPSYAGDEALKAQAVACRTFVVHRAVVSATHSGAHVCTNPGHCQAYTSKSRFIAKYGAAGTEFYNRAYNAAKSTSGVIAVYNGSPITAAFHASSGGSTMSSADVWGGSLPYLVPVYSPEQDDPEIRKLISAHKSFSKEVFIRYLSASGYSAVSEYYGKSFDSFIGPITHTNSGKVANVLIAGQNVSGQTLKDIFSLRSTCFSISYDEKNITFVCLGYGHGVGMSQLGACAMAKQGASYADILTHYYTGVDLVIW